MRRFGSRARGAGVVEYAIIVVAVLLIAAGSYKMLGGQLAKRGSGAGDVVSGDDEGGGKKGGGEAAGGGKSGGGSGGDGHVAGKAHVAGAGGGGSESGGGATSARDTSDSNGPKNAPASVTGSSGPTNVDEGFNSKRWMGIGFLVVGVIALVYVLMTMRGAKKMGNALGPSKSGKRA
ncbi:MAG: hypothetical protein KIT84_23475 [Labilithrix sp.]|nr:hypothetical protein [Labilithrix sp.]MCW5814009.1 hypothetical protein [Labilithrix sp.]